MFNPPLNSPSLEGTQVLSVGVLIWPIFNQLKTWETGHLHRLTAIKRFMGEERVNLSLQEKLKNVNFEKRNVVVPPSFK